MEGQFPYNFPIPLGAVYARLQCLRPVPSQPGLASADDGLHPIRDLEFGEVLEMW